MITEMDDTCAATGATTGAFRLFDLPQELIDIVFEFAYPAVVDLHLIFKEDWYEQQKAKKRLERAKYIAQPFPPRKVEEWIVSKRYFDAAAKTWMGTQSFNVPKRHQHFRLVSSYSAEFVLNNITLYTKLATHAKLPLAWAFETTASRLESLKYLALQVQDDVFDLVEGKSAWSDTLDVTDFSLVAVDSNLDLLSGLCKLTLVPATFPNLTLLEKTTWEQNLNLLENYVNERMCKQRQVVSPSDLRARDELAAMRSSTLSGRLCRAMSQGSGQRPVYLAETALTSREDDYVKSLLSDAVPAKLRCAICSRIAFDAFQLCCCKATTCAACHNTPVQSCAVCSACLTSGQRSPPYEYLRLLLKIWIKAELNKHDGSRGHAAALKEVSEDRQSSTIKPVIQPIADGPVHASSRTQNYLKAASLSQTSELPLFEAAIQRAEFHLIALQEEASACVPGSRVPGLKARAETEWTEVDALEALAVMAARVSKLNADFQEWIANTSTGIRQICKLAVGDDPQEAQFASAGQKDELGVSEPVSRQDDDLREAETVGGTACSLSKPAFWDGETLVMILMMLLLSAGGVLLLLGMSTAGSW